MYIIIANLVTCSLYVVTLFAVLEFIYAQSPESMKGMLTGIFFFIGGIFSAGASIVFFVFVHPNSPLLYQFSYFYLIVLLFTVLGFVAYTVVACLYTNHQRPGSVDDDESNVRLLYNTFRQSV